MLILMTHNITLFTASKIKIQASNFAGTIKENLNTKRKYIYKVIIENTLRYFSND